MLKDEREGVPRAHRRIGGEADNPSAQGVAGTLTDPQSRLVRVFVTHRRVGFPGRARRLVDRPRSAETNRPSCDWTHCRPLDDASRDCVGVAAQGPEAALPVVHTSFLEQGCPVSAGGCRRRMETLPADSRLLPDTS